MPELPEVQTIVNDLNKKVVGRRIVNVWSDFPKMFKKSPLALEKIKGKKILRVGRRGKNILIDLADNLLLLIHQKLTGHLLVGKWKIEANPPVGGRPRVIPLEPKELVTDPFNSYIHLIFYLDPVRSRPPQGGRSHSPKARAASNGVDNGQMLGLSDLRKFAKVILGQKEQIENLPDLKDLGPDALDSKLTPGKFKETLRQARGKVKQVLMDQEVIAGIGNIYSDEILWLAKIHPFKPTNKLSEKELKNLYAGMKKVLEKAVKMRGTSISDYRDTAGKKGKYTEIRSVYQREGEPCRRCKTSIARVKLGGRSAHFCPACQRLRP